MTISVGILCVQSVDTNWTTFRPIENICKQSATFLVTQLVHMILENISIELGMFYTW